MVKRVKVKLFGFQNRHTELDADATDGARVGQNLWWGDGTLVQESEIRNTSGGGTTGTPSTGSTVQIAIWSLIQNIPAIIKSLAALATNGWIRNDAGVISASYWPYTKLSVDTGEEMTIPTGHELIVFDSFTMDGSITLDGDLVILE